MGRRLATSHCHSKACGNSSIAGEREPLAETRSRQRREMRILVLPGQASGRKVSFTAAIEMSGVHTCFDTIKVERDDGTFFPFYGTDGPRLIRADVRHSGKRTYIELDEEAAQYMQDQAEKMRREYKTFAEIRQEIAGQLGISVDDVKFDRHLWEGRIERCETEGMERLEYPYPSMVNGGKIMRLQTIEDGWGYRLTNNDAQIIIDSEVAKERDYVPRTELMRRTGLSDSGVAYKCRTAGIEPVRCGKILYIPRKFAEQLEREMVPLQEQPGTVPINPILRRVGIDSETFLYRVTHAEDGDFFQYDAIVGEEGHEYVEQRRARVYRNQSGQYNISEQDGEQLVRDKEREKAWWTDEQVAAEFAGDKKPLSRGAVRLRKDTSSGTYRIPINGANEELPYLQVEGRNRINARRILETRCTPERRVEIEWPTVEEAAVMAGMETRAFEATRTDRGNYLILLRDGTTFEIEGRTVNGVARANMRCTRATLEQGRPRLAKAEESNIPILVFEEAPDRKRVTLASTLGDIGIAIDHEWAYVKDGGRTYFRFFGTGGTRLIPLEEVVSGKRHWWTISQEAAQYIKDDRTRMNGEYVTFADARQDIATAVGVEVNEVYAARIQGNVKRRQVEVNDVPVEVCEFTHASISHGGNDLMIRAVDDGKTYRLRRSDAEFIKRDEIERRTNWVPRVTVMNATGLSDSGIEQRCKKQGAKTATCGRIFYIEKTFADLLIAECAERRELPGTRPIYPVLEQVGITRNAFLHNVEHEGDRHFYTYDAIVNGQVVHRRVEIFKNASDHYQILEQDAGQLIADRLEEEVWWTESRVAEEYSSGDKPLSEDGVRGRRQPNQTYRIPIDGANEELPYITLRGRNRIQAHRIIEDRWIDRIAVARELETGSLKNDKRRRVLVVETRDGPVEIPYIPIRNRQMVNPKVLASCKAKIASMGGIVESGVADEADHTHDGSRVGLANLIKQLGMSMNAANLIERDDGTQVYRFFGIEGIRLIPCEVDREAGGYRTISREDADFITEQTRTKQRGYRSITQIRRSIAQELGIEESEVFSLSWVTGRVDRETVETGSDKVERVTFSYPSLSNGGTIPMRILVDGSEYCLSNTDAETIILDEIARRREYTTIKELANEWGITPRGAILRCKAMGVPSVVVRKEKLVRRADLEERSKPQAGLEIKLETGPVEPTSADVVGDNSKKSIKPRSRKTIERKPRQTTTPPSLRQAMRTPLKEVVKPAPETQIPEYSQPLADVLAARPVGTVAQIRKRAGQHWFWYETIIDGRAGRREVQVSAESDGSGAYRIAAEGIAQIDADLAEEVRYANEDEIAQAFSIDRGQLEGYRTGTRYRIPTVVHGTVTVECLLLRGERRVNRERLTAAVEEANRLPEGLRGFDEVRAEHGIANDDGWIETRRGRKYFCYNTTDNGAVVVRRVQILTFRGSRYVEPDGMTQIEADRVNPLTYANMEEAAGILGMGIDDLRGTISGREVGYTVRAVTGEEIRIPTIWSVGEIRAERSQLEIAAARMRLPEGSEQLDQVLAETGVTGHAVELDNRRYGFVYSTVEGTGIVTRTVPLYRQGNNTYLPPGTRAQLERDAAEERNWLGAAEVARELGIEEQNLAAYRREQGAFFVQTVTGERISVGYVRLRGELRVHRDAVENAKIERDRMPEGTVEITDQLATLNGQVRENRGRFELEYETIINGKQETRRVPVYRTRDGRLHAPRESMETIQRDRAEETGYVTEAEIARELGVDVDQLARWKVLQRDRYAIPTATGGTVNLNFVSLRGERRISREGLAATVQEANRLPENAQPLEAVLAAKQMTGEVRVVDGRPWLYYERMPDGQGSERRVQVYRTLDGQDHLAPEEVARIDRDIAKVREYANETEVAAALSMAPEALTARLHPHGNRYVVKSAIWEDVEVYGRQYRGRLWVDRVVLEGVKKRIDRLPPRTKPLAQILEERGITGTVEETSQGYMLTYETIAGGQACNRRVPVFRTTDGNFHIDRQGRERLDIDKAEETKYAGEAEVANALNMELATLQTAREGSAYALRGVTGLRFAISFIMLRGEPRVNRVKLRSHAEGLNRLPKGVRELQPLLTGREEFSRVNDGNGRYELCYETVEGGQVVQRTIPVYRCAGVEYVDQAGARQIEADRAEEARHVSENEIAGALGVEGTALQRDDPGRAYSVISQTGRRIEIPFVTLRGQILVSRAKLASAKERINDIPRDLEKLADILEGEEADISIGEMRETGGSYYFCYPTIQNSTVVERRIPVRMIGDEPYIDEASMARIEADFAEEKKWVGEAEVAQAVGMDAAELAGHRNANGTGYIVRSARGNDVAILFVELRGQPRINRQVLTQAVAEINRLPKGVRELQPLLTGREEFSRVNDGSGRYELCYETVQDGMIVQRTIQVYRRAGIDYVDRVGARQIEADRAEEANYVNRTEVRQIAEEHGALLSIEYGRNKYILWQSALDRRVEIPFVMLRNEERVRRSELERATRELEKGPDGMQELRAVLAARHLGAIARVEMISGFPVLAYGTIRATRGIPLTVAFGRQYIGDAGVAQIDNDMKEEKKYVGEAEIAAALGIEIGRLTACMNADETAYRVRTATGTFVEIPIAILRGERRVERTRLTAANKEIDRMPDGSRLLSGVLERLGIPTEIRETDQGPRLCYETIDKSGAIVNREVAVHRRTNGVVWITPRGIRQLELDKAEEAKYVGDSEVRSMLAGEEKQLRRDDEGWFYSARAATGVTIRVQFVRLRGEIRVNRAALNEAKEQIERLPEDVEELSDAVEEGVFGSTGRVETESDLPVFRYETINGTRTIRLLTIAGRQCIDQEGQRQIQADREEEARYADETEASQILGIELAGLERNDERNVYTARTVMGDTTQIPFLIVRGERRIRKAQLQNARQEIDRLPEGSQEVAQVLARAGVRGDVDQNGLAYETVEGEAVIRRIIAVRRTLDGRAHLTPNEIAQIERDVSAEREFADETEIARGLGISASELTGCRGECCYDIRTADGREARLAYVLLRGDPRVNRARLDEVVDQLNPLPTGAEEAESVIGSTTCSMRSTPVGIDRATGTISYETVEGGVVVRRTMEVRRRGEQFFLGSEDAARYRTDMNVERNWFNEWRTATRLGIRQEELARYRNGREYVVPSLANGDVRIPFLLVDGKPRFDSAQLDEYKARIMALPAGAERLTDVTRRIGMVQTNGISGGRTTRQLEYDAIEGERVVRHRVKLFPLDEIDYIAPDGIAQIQADKNAEAGWFTTSETARRLGIGLTDLMWYKSKNEQCYMIPIKGGKKVRFPYITYQGATRIRLGDQQLKVKDDGPD